MIKDIYPMIATLFLYLIAGAIAGWLISAAWGFNLLRIVGIVTAAGIFFAIFVYFFQSMSEPVDIARLLGLTVIYVIAANLGAIIAADVTSRRWTVASR